MCETVFNTTDMDCSKVLRLQEICKTPSLRWWHVVHLLGHIRSCLLWCKKQTAVLHSSVESGIISFDAGLRVDGSPAFLRQEQP